MEKKKFHTLMGFNYFLRSEHGANGELINLDLSNLDLSSFPPQTWTNFSFYNVDFSNTKIRLNPKLLRSGWFPADLRFCNFTGCDLSDWEDGCLDYVRFIGSNFTNTGLHAKITLKDHPNCIGDDKQLRGVLLGDKYTEEELRELMRFFDLDTIKKYPNFNIKGQDILDALHININIDYLSFRLADFCSTREIDYYDLVRQIKDGIELDKEKGGELHKVYEELKKHSKNKDLEFTEEDELLFFMGYVLFKDFDEIDFSSFDEEIVKRLHFIDCRFDKVKFKSYFNLLNQDREHYYRGELYGGCSFGEIVFDDITPSAWIQNVYNRFEESHATFRTDAYVELDRACNAKCEFCRNHCMKPCKYDLDQITRTILDYPQIDSLVIGGGEPTLRMDDLNTLLNNVIRQVDSVNIFSNATDYDKIAKLGKNGFINLNISRHAIDDNVNDKIFGIRTLTRNELRELDEDINTYIHLCCTCFKGDGVDSLKKMKDYLKMAEEVKARTILFQTLEEDLGEKNALMPIDPQVIDKMIDYLKRLGWKISNPIYSTGDYKLIIATKPNHGRLKAISFKRYITEEELQSEWYKAQKRTFDLSIDPAGNLYQNWHQSSGLVLRKKEKDTN